MHTLCLRIDNATLDWCEPGEVPEGAPEGTPPREQKFIIDAKWQAVFLPPLMPPSLWILRDDLVDLAVAANGWNILPIQIRLVFVFVSIFVFPAFRI